GTEYVGVLPLHRRLEEAGPALRPGREKAKRVLPGLVEPLGGAQPDVRGRRLRPEQVGEDTLAVVGVVEEQEQVTQADQGVRAVARAGQRVRAAVYVAHHVDSHVTTVSGLSLYCRVGILVGEIPCANSACRPWRRSRQPRTSPMSSSAGPPSS